MLLTFHIPLFTVRNVTLKVYSPFPHYIHLFLYGQMNYV